MSTSNLKNQLSGHATEFTLNEPQAKIHMVRANRTVVLAGRGGGKTVGALSPWCVNVAEKLRGALVGVFGSSHEQLQKNIVPKITLGFTKLGYREGVDFVVGVKPPQHWPKCLYTGIKKWDKTFVWKSGTVFQQVSLHEKGDANAFDFQAGLFDEAKYLNYRQIEDEVIPTLRGFEEKFESMPEYLSTIYATDKMYDFLKIQWLLNYRMKVNHALVDKILQNEYLISRLYQALPDANAYQKRKIEQQIRAINKLNDKDRIDLTYVSEFSAVDNIDNLGVKWLANKLSSMTRYVFNVAILNHDPTQAQVSFYHALHDGNFHNTKYDNEDFDLSKPVIVGMDYQHSVAPLLVSQLNTKVNGRAQLNYINEFDTVYPHGIRDAIKLMCDYYKPLGLKRVLYVYDQTAKGKRVDAEPLYKVVVKAFKKNGISVREVYMGDTPDHFDKYLQINEALQGNKWIPVSFNKNKIINARISISGAGTKITNGITKKDKELENAGKYPSIDQRHTTHYSDVFDQINWAVIEQKLIKFNIVQSGGIKTR